MIWFHRSIPPKIWSFGTPRWDLQPKEINYAIFGIREFLGFTAVESSKSESPKKSANSLYFCIRKFHFATWIFAPKFHNQPMVGLKKEDFCHKIINKPYSKIFLPWNPRYHIIFLIPRDGAMCVVTICKKNDKSRGPKTSRKRGKNYLRLLGFEPGPYRLVKKFTFQISAPDRSATEERYLM